MTFQFMCPHGHLLQGDISQMGHPCQCPHCGITFIIPTVQVHPQYTPAHQHVEQHHAPYEDFTQPDEHAQGGVSDFLSHLTPAHAEEPAHHEEHPHAEEPHETHEVQGVVDLEAAAAEAGVLHIPCPNGHALETPFDMIGQEVLCPHCGAQFRLRTEDSIEYRQRQEKILHQRSEFWFKWSIAAAVVVLLGLIGMMVVISQH